MGEVAVLDGAEPDELDEWATRRELGEAVCNDASSERAVRLRSRDGVLWILFGTFIPDVGIRST